MTSMLRALRPLISPRLRARLPFAVAGSVFVGLLDVATVLLMYPLIQLFTSPDNRTGVLGTISGFFGDPGAPVLLLILLGLVTLGYSVRAVLTIAFRWWQIGLTSREQADAAHRLYVRFMGETYQQHKLRDIASITRSIDSFVPQAYGMVIQGLISSLTEILSLAILAVSMFAVMPLPTLAATAYFLLAGYVLLRVSRSGPERIGIEMAELDFSIARLLFQGMQGFRDVRLAGMLGSFTEDYRAGQNRRADLRRVSAMYSEVPKYIIDVIFVVGVAVMSGVLLLTVDFTQTLAMLAIFVAAGTRILPGVNRFLANVNSVRVGLPAMRLLSEEVQQLSDTEPYTEPSTWTAFPAGTIEVSGVGFRYSAGGPLVLDGVDLSIPHGESVALVGTSGAGKTTLVDLLTGVLAPTEGSITVAGRSIHAEPHAWHQQLALVPQDVVLFSDSLANNIVFGREHDEARLQHAIDRASLRSVVEHLPQGVETPVGDRGAALSGGQRQRVGIARALYRDPQVLILDEATSALDNQTEHDIAASITSVRGEITTVVVAHRLSTVRHCDRVVFLDHGTVRAIGTFEELQGMVPEFARMVELGSLN